MLVSSFKMIFYDYTCNDKAFGITDPYQYTQKKEGAIVRHFPVQVFCYIGVGSMGVPMPTIPWGGRPTWSYRKI